jgi:hypothetical protein
MEDKRDKIAIVSVIVSVLLFLLITGTLTSGYHFVDDHEIIRMKNDLKSASLNNVTKAWVKEDLFVNTRFRPLYYIHRVIEARVMGSDFTLWSVYNGFLYCLALVFLYLGTRRLKFTVGESVVILIITFIGPQCSILWRLGPGESLGMVFLGLAFYFMTASLTGKNFLVKNLLFILFLILSSLTKESLLIIVPSMVIFKIWNEKLYFGTTLKESIIKNLLLILPLLVVAAEVYYIKKYVGIGYSGLDGKLSESILGIFSTALHFIKTYLNLVIVALILLFSALFFKKKLPGINLPAIVFFILIIVPNMILYAKSGLVERYLLPSSLGLGFLVATLIRNIKEDQGWLKRAAMLLVIVSFLPYLVTSFNDARKFAKEGALTKKLFSAISSENVKGSQVMVVVDPVDSYEISVSLKTYLHYESDIDLFGYCFIKKDFNESEQGYVDGWKSYFDGRLFENLASPPAMLIFLDKRLTEEFFSRSTLTQSSYVSVDLGDSPFEVLKSSRK